MPGYLIDTNHVSAWEKADPKFMARLRKRPAENIIWVSSITLGELESGLRITTSSNPSRRLGFRRFVQAELLQFVHGIGVATRESYASVVEAIWGKHPPNNKNVSTQRHLTSLDVDVNDVWIVAVALEHNLTLLTGDRMLTIRDCVPALRVENWLL